MLRTKIGCKAKTRLSLQLRKKKAPGLFITGFCCQFFHICIIFKNEYAKVETCQKSCKASKRIRLRNIIADIANKDNRDPKDDPKGDLKELSERQSLMLDLIKSDDLITIHQMTQKINVSEKTIKRELAFLQEKGILTREGGRKEGKWVILIEE